MSADSSRAVFLSYASQDAAPARRLAEALRAAGVQVWFDQNELVGGDVWDAKIRKQIAECALFVPVISAHTQARLEGYFRIEWKLAAQRTHAMADEMAFLLPVVIDDTRDAEALVPAEFKAVQWTRLPSGDGAEKFCARVRGLLEGHLPAPAGDRMPAAPSSRPRKRARIRAWLVLLALALVAAPALVLWHPWRRIESPSTAGSHDTEARRLIRRALEITDRSVERDATEAALDLANKAAALDASDEEVLGHAARLDAWMVYMGYDRSPARRQQAQTRAARALRFAPDSVVARWARATVYAFADGSPEMLAEAERIFRPLAASTTEKKLLSEFGTVLRDRKKFDEAAAVFERAGDPGSAAWNYVLADRFEDARRIVAGLPRSVHSLHLKVYVEMIGFEDLDAAYATVGGLTVEELQNEALVVDAVDVWLARREPERVIRLLNAFPGELFESKGFSGPKRYFIGLAYRMQGNAEAAQAEWRAALAQVREKSRTLVNDRYALGCEAILLACLGEKEEAERVRRLFGSITQLASNEDKYFEAIILAQLGRADDARALLEGVFRAKERSWEGLHAYARLSAEFEPLRRDPRFEQLLRETLPKTARPFAAPAAATDRSVAVVAFADLSPAHDSEYFSDGISEELLNVLAKVPGLKVTARTSAFFFKGKNLPVPEIAQQLGVAYLVEGSVQRAGDHVRITAQLIKAADGFQVWSERFDRELKNVFALQDEIAGLIAEQLSLKLGASSAAATASVKPEAFDLYVQARQVWNRRALEELGRAEQLLNRALELEPDFARAHAALVDVWLSRGQYEGTVSLFGQRESPLQLQIVARARKALALDADSAEAHASLGVACWMGWSFAEAVRELRAAVALNPNYASAHQWLGRVLMDEGWIEESLAELKLASELDPLSSRIMDNRATANVVAGRYREALALYDRALALQPGAAQAQAGKATLLIELGRFDEAVALARGLPEGKMNRATQVVVYARAGLRAEAEALLPEIDPRVLNRATYRLALRDWEGALAALDPAEATAVTAEQLLLGPALDPIRGDARYLKFIAALGLTEAHARAQAWRAKHPPEKTVPEQ